ncbi:MAG: SpoIIIAH-like family protein [Ruminococcaceae bacterium]|nr:SpoIIIAH-like family protein [Oscillospiraceae bacterium]
MKIWKRNAVAVTVFLFVCAGIYLNWYYTKQADTPALEQTLNSEQVMGEDTLVFSSDGDSAPAEAAKQTAAEAEHSADSFATIRLSRQGARDAAIETLQETIAYAEGDDSATTTSKELEDIVQTSLSEAQIESLIVAKGFEDCVAYMTDEGISIAVAAPEDGLKDSDVALISDVVTGQTDYDLTDIRIIEVK